MKKGKPPSPTETQDVGKKLEGSPEFLSDFASRDAMMGRVASEGVVAVEATGSMQQADATTLAAAVRSGRWSATEVAKVFLERIVAEDDFQCFLRTTPSRALEAAQEVDRRIASGEDAGLLAGVPVALKDNLALAREPMTCASRSLEGFVPEQDAWAVTCLLRAGAIPVGKTNLDEFSMGVSTETGVQGPCRNPHDLRRVAGGSSGGSAVAVAAGLVPLAIGSDSGGSIRLPAAFCGVLGLKPSYGAVSRRGLVAFASSLDQVGPLARSARDLALALRVVAQPDAQDATSGKVLRAESLLDPATGDLSGWRLGLVRQWSGDALAAPVRQALDRACRSLEQLGAQIEPIDLPLLEMVAPCYRLLAAAEASLNLARFDGVRYGYTVGTGGDYRQAVRQVRWKGLGPEVRRRILLGTFVLTEGHREDWVLQAARVRRLLQVDLLRALEGFHGLMGATAPELAFPIGRVLKQPLVGARCDGFTAAANLAGLPAISIPCGRGERTGLPMGLHILAGEGQEGRLLRVARELELGTGYHGDVEEGFLE
jgi:aspartyl-tRNA(Asn)/glutamyl-tRNA(Gln) amidotransferase subunit A